MAKYIRPILTDPVWQGIGGVVAILALALALYQLVPQPSPATPTPVDPSAVSFGDATQQQQTGHPTASPSTLANRSSLQAGLPMPTFTPPANPLAIEMVSHSGRDEFVTIRNNGSAAQDMTGWSLVSVVGTQTYHFSNRFVLDAGASVQVHSGPDAAGDPSGNLLWSTGYIWRDDWDKAELRDSAGVPVSSWCYGAGCP